MSMIQKARGSEGFVGIDVSKATLDICFGKQHYQILNTKAEIKKFIAAHMQDAESIALCVLESTGGYERGVLQALHKAQIATHRAHPSRVHAFAKACNHFAKTDKLDALLLQKYASFVSATERGDREESAHQQELKSFRQLLRSIEEQLHGAQCRIKQYPEQCYAVLAEQIRMYRKQIEKINKQMQSIVQGDARLQQQVKLMQSMPGIGLKSATLLLAELPELGRLGKKQIAALLGVAPKTSESGRTVRRARIFGGRFYARKVMYMCALVASRYEPRMRELYQRLIAMGKAKKVALVAIMRKMIVCLNAMLKNNIAFYPLSA